MAIFEKIEHGFWKQMDAKPIEYDENYKAVQKTTPFMAGIRIGYLLDALKINANDLSGMVACDVGSGNGCMSQSCWPLFKRFCNYDLSGDSITADELYSTAWDVIFLTDVLEHFSNIDDLFKINFRRLLLSFPETPSDFQRQDDLIGWRHYRPDEHIYCLNAAGVCDWLEARGYYIAARGNPEDAIRKYPPHRVNISTVVAIRNKPE